MIKKSDSVLRIKRIFEIHKILRKSDGVSAIEIVKMLEGLGFDTNERMVASDIADLRLLGAEVSANRHRGYWYAEPFSMLESLEGVDRGNLNEILAFVRQKANDELFKGNLAKLLINLEQEVRNPDLEENPYIQFEKVELKNIEKLDLFYKYIIEKRVLDIEFEPYGEEVKKVTIVPILLKEFNNRWAVIAFEKLSNKYDKFPLDRIKSQKLSFEILSGNSSLEPKKYFKDVIGYTHVDGSYENIIIKIKKNRAYYVDTKKWHHSQTNHLELEDSTSMTFSLRVIPNREFWAKVMEHVEDIEILEPEDMVKEFRERVRRVWERVEEK